MQIIPVLDLKDGLVVRGVMGERTNYRPIETPLAASADPVAVARGLMGLGAFEAFYIADLDAIEGRAPNTAAVEALEEAFPQTRLWVDAGLKTPADLGAVPAGANRLAVAGTESLEDPELLAAPDFRERGALSLDFRGDTFLGPREVLDEPDIWPERIIVMTLARVGSGAGPDLDRLVEIRRRAGPRRAVYAAGGVRGPGDLYALKNAGVAGALIATALHDGRLAPHDLARLR